MKVRLLHPEQDDAPAPLLRAQSAINEDLEFTTLFTAMADGDEYLRLAVSQVVPDAVTDPAVIRYRQDVLTDCLAHPAEIRQIYAIAVDGTNAHRKVWLAGLQYHQAEPILHRGVELLGHLAANLRQLRVAATANAPVMRSTGFRQLFAMLEDQLGDDYLASIDAHLAELRLPHGVLFSAGLAAGNKTGDIVLHPGPQLQRWWQRLTGAGHHGGWDFEIAANDVAGGQALTELTGRAINEIANVVSQSVDHIQGFFNRLRFELAHYLGCVNLHAALTARGVPVCFPDVTGPGSRVLSATDLRDVSLCLTTSATVVGNDLDADSTSLIVVTGANEGGKSTFLRSVGSAHVMLAAGMFVTATSVRAALPERIFTHFKREEDATLNQGKLDEELSRMSGIADEITANSLLLCNESFASTNEREGSQIAADVVTACTQAGVRVVFVTHLFEFAHHRHTAARPGELFLRAVRRTDGTRSFHIQPGPPESTSHGQDSFARVFGSPLGSSHAGGGG